MRKSEKLSQAWSALEISGFRRTKPREAILEFLASEHGPFSIEEVARGLRKKDLVTVYRTLSLFEKSGIVRRCDFGDGVARYEFLEDPSHHHHHVICTSCRKSESLDDCKVPGRLESEVKSRGYSNVHHSLEFFGVCLDCSRKSVEIR